MARTELHGHRLYTDTREMCGRDRPERSASKAYGGVLWGCPVTLSNVNIKCPSGLEIARIYEHNGAPNELRSTWFPKYTANKIKKFISTCFGHVTSVCHVKEHAYVWCEHMQQRG